MRDHDQPVNLSESRDLQTMNRPTSPPSSLFSRLRTASLPAAVRYLATSLLLIFAGAAVTAVAADDPAGSVAESNGQPEGLRLRANALYLDAPVRTRVAQRFEMYSPRTEEELPELKNMGFTQVMLDRPNLHRAAAQAGLNFVLAHWWNHDTKPEDITAAVERAAQTDRQRLIGFSVMDEPERNSPETPFGFYIDLYEKLAPQFRRDFPHTRMEISHWGPLADWTDQHYEYFSFLYEAADVMRIMPYPDLKEGPLDDVFFMIQRTQRMMELADRRLPLVVILQTWILPPENKLPGIAELRVMTYQAMLSGAETVSFFDYNVEVWKQTPGFESGFQTLMREVTTFSRTFRDHEVASVMSADGVLTSILTAPSGQITRLIVNTRREAVGDLPPLAVRRETFGIPLTSVASTDRCVSGIVVCRCHANGICRRCQPGISRTTCRPCVVRDPCRLICNF